MESTTYFFAGGGTGGHIYPAIAVAQKLQSFEPGCDVRFFCSKREIDSAILKKTGYDFDKLPARSLSKKPVGFVSFLIGYYRSFRMAKKILRSKKKAVVISLGGFVSAGVVGAAKKLGLPIGFINVDIVPGKANRFTAKNADEVYVQFESTAKYFDRSKVFVTGCPLREEFENADAQNAIEELCLDREKKVLLITGASSGALNINLAMERIAEKLSEFAEDLQIVHLTGKGKDGAVCEAYAKAGLESVCMDYYHNMPDLFKAADVVVGRSGAVSVAEYAKSGLPAICVPYPYHEDRHQFLNAQQLVEIGSAIIVEENIHDLNDTSERLWIAVEGLLKDENKRESMSRASVSFSEIDSASKIAEKIIAMSK